MKSQRLIFRTHGNPHDVLELEEFDTAELNEGEVLLEIQASPINPADLNYIEGTYGIKPELPATAGIECFAKVIESRSAKFSPGDSVMPISKIGGWSSYAVASEQNLIRLPDAIDPLQAAMLKVNPATALLLLTHFEALEKGDWVTLNASNSGVGQCIIQLAADMGISTLCFLRDTSLSATLSDLGATHVFEDSQEGLTQAREILANDRAKLAFNAVGGDSALRLMKLLKTAGTHITYGAMGRKPLTIPNGPLIFNDIRVRGLWVTKWIESCELNELMEAYEKLANLVVSGTLRQAVSVTCNISHFAQAFDQLHAAHRKGKVLFVKNSLQEVPVA